MKVSVTVPVYNTGVLLSRCLKSLAHQIFSEYEVIVVDDGSTDHSLDIAKQYESRYPNIFKVVAKVNGGQASARNTGINVASGDYLAFVDSDDWVAPNYIQGLYDACKNFDADISMCGVLRVWEDGTNKKFASGFSNTCVYTDIPYVLKHTSNSPCNKLFHKSLFSNLRFIEGMVYEDFALIPQIIVLAKKIVYINVPLYYYFWRSNSTTNKKNINHDQIKAIEILEESKLSLYPDVLEYYNVKEILCSYLWTLLRVSGNEKLAKKTISRVFTKYRCIPSNISSFPLPSLREKIFLRIVITNNIALMKSFVKTVEFIRKVVRKIR